MKQRFWRSLGVAAFAFAFAGLSFAQTTGAIRGKVVDAEANALPGVQIRVTGSALLGERVAYSEATGAYSFSALPPGEYTLEATLAGFAKYTHEGIRVGIAQTKNIPVEMQLESVSSEITVVAEEPLLDASSQTTGGRISYEELIQVPTARDPWAVLSLIPSVQVDRINVGGSESGQQSNFVAKGDNGDNAIWNVDGVNITDQSAVGASPTYYDFGAIEEIQVSTGGTDVTHMTAGAGINIVTKKGSNNVKGSVRTYFSNDSLQGENISDELAADGFRSKSVDQILEFGGEVGFPVVKDRLWVWGSGNRNKLDNITITDVPDNTELINFAAKLNGQVTSSNEAALFYHYGDKKKQGRNAATTRPPETTWNQKGPSPIYKIEDQQIFGSNTVLTGKFAYVGGGFELKPQGGGTYEGQDITAYRDADRVWHGTYLDHETTRPQSSAHLDGSHFMTTGNIDHEFKFGFEYRTASVDSYSFWPGGQIALANVFGEGISLARFSRDLGNFATMDRVSVYLQDTLNFGSLTVNLGLRFDTQSGHHDGGNVNAHPLFPDLLPSVSFGAGESLFTWSDITPRLGLSYELGQNTLLKASYAMYADNLSLGIAGQGNPAYVYSFVQAPAIDTNGDGTIQLDELVGDLQGPVPSDPVNIENIDQIDSDLSSPTVNEVILGASHQFTKDVVVGLNFTYRHRTNTTWSLGIVEDATGASRPVQAGDFVPAEMTLDGSFSSDIANGSYSGVQYFELAPGLEWTGGTFLTNREDYAQDFLGVEVNWNKRFSDNWLFGGNVSFSDWTESFDANGPGADPDPTRDLLNPNPDGEGTIAARSAGSGAFADVFLNANWQTNLRASYTLPFGVELGTNVNWRQGFPVPVVDSRGIDPFDGDDRSILLTELDEFRQDSPFLVDFRVAYRPTLGPVDLELGVDVFNVFNSATILQTRREADLGSFGSPVEILGPRLFRFGARVIF